MAFKTGQVLCEPGDRLHYAFFPDSCVISIVNLMREGRAIEVGTVGREGMSVLAPLFGVDFSPHRIQVQVPGTALRVKIATLRETSAPGTPLWNVLSRYSVAFAMQLMQSVACAKFHSVDERCCRWLLATHDRVLSDRIPLTHEFLALMLGTRRTSVSQVLKKLQDRGAIRYRRGTIEIIDRAALEARSCECHATVAGMYRRIMGLRQ